MRRPWFSTLTLGLVLSAAGCVSDPTSTEAESETEGDGDGDPTGDGDGDGDPTGDGDGDGDGDPTGDGDGDGEPIGCDEGLTMCCPNGAANCADEWVEPFNTPEWQRWGCVDTQISRFHCGGCSNVCPSDDLEDGNPGRCELSECAPYYQGCVHAEAPTVTCDDVCASVGKTCAANECGFAMAGAPTMRVFTPGMDGCWDGVYKHPVDVACDQPIPVEEVPAEVSCCCSLE
jgi:hypothetical protein